MNDEVLYKTVRMTHLSEGACVISFKAVNAARSPSGRSFIGHRGLT